MRGKNRHAVRGRRPCTYDWLRNRDKHLVDCVCAGCQQTFQRYPSHVSKFCSLRCKKLASGKVVHSEGTMAVFPGSNYTDEQVEFLRAMTAYQQRTGRRFPGPREVLAIVASLGYRRHGDFPASPRLRVPVSQKVA